ncbi:MAG: nuclease-related domain-containing protein [Pseudomonas sp.]|jgi:hypothetical protein|nr:nuclease-related domain-containing protein [Pseudomonas sp.]
MSILVYGKNADRTHENQMLQEFIQILKADWEHAGKDIILIPNSMWNAAEIDLVCILPAALLLIDFKNYKGHLKAAENGPWFMGDVEVKGGSRENPYHQLLINKRAVMQWLKHHSLLQSRNVTHVSAAVVFSGPITGQPILSPKVKPWFHTTDFANCANLLSALASPDLQIYPQDIQAILKTLGVQQITVIKPPPKGCLLKSALVAGGVFLMMAVVSQIYPTIGQSSSVVTYAPQPVQSVQPVKPQSIATVVNTQQYQQAATPLATRNHDATTYIEQIDVQAASRYIGQEVAACGRVAQATPFKKGVYLNLDKAHPHQALTLVLWDESLAAVENKLGGLTDLVGVDLCARGSVTEYSGRPRIEISDAPAVYLKSNQAKIAATNQQDNEVSVERIEAYRAPFYVGQQVIACGVLAGTSTFAKGLYLSLDKKYPNQTLTLIVWSESVALLEAKFGSFDSRIGQTFCALGTIEKYKKNLQVKIENPQFLRLMLN